MAGGDLASIGQQTDAESVAGDGTLIALTKRHRTLLGTIIVLLGAGLPLVLVNGSLDVRDSVSTAAAPTYTEANNVKLSTDLAGNLRVKQQAATLHVTAVGAVNTAVTATIPAAGAGLFHHFTSVELIKGYSVVGVAAGAGVTITSTNLPGGPAWSTEQNATAAGARVRVIDYTPTTPLRSAVANTATTFVAPAQLQTIWRWNVSYFTGP